MTISHGGHNYELFAQRPNWSNPPAWELQWQRAVASAVRGDEDRADYRRVPKAVYDWMISLSEDADWAALQVQVEAALVAGRAAAPLWTRPSAILSNDGTTTLYVDPTGLLWEGPHPSGGRYTYTVWCDGAIRQVVAYDELTGALTLDLPILSNSEEIFAVVFGRLEVTKDMLQTSQHGDIALRICAPEWIVPDQTPADPQVHSNTAQSYTATCGVDYRGNPVTVTVPAGAFTSYAPQAELDAQALALATSQALGSIVCIYELIQLTVVLSSGVVATRLFYFTDAPGASLERYDLTVDGVLAATPIYLFNHPTAPRLGAVKIAFNAVRDGVYNTYTAWGKP